MNYQKKFFLILLTLNATSIKPNWIWDPIREQGKKIIKNLIGHNFFTDFFTSQPNIEKLKESIDSDAFDPNASDNYGNTLLMCAVIRPLPEIVELLLEKGADPDRKNKDGNTALLFALASKQEHIVQILVDNKAKSTITNSSLKTPLHVAVEQNLLETIPLLLPKDKNSRKKLLNAQDKNGDTALMIAIRNANADIINLLLENGIDSSKTNKNKFNALDLAYYYGEEDTVASLSDPENKDVSLLGTMVNTSLEEEFKRQYSRLNATLQTMTIDQKLTISTSEINKKLNSSEQTKSE